MVLVLHHILIAVVQFLRRGQQVFLKPDEQPPPPPPPQPCADSLQVGGAPSAGHEEDGVSGERSAGSSKGRAGTSSVVHSAPEPSSKWGPLP